MNLIPKHIKSKINPGTLLVLGCLCLLIFWNIAVFAGNPYGVAGSNWEPNSTMIKLGMPDGTQAYIWDSLQKTNDYVMVRPCDYWQRVNGFHRAHGYHEDTDTIHNPAAFGQWVANNRGKIWIIGNEPDDGGQDALTIEAYARMYRTYYTFIRNIDPSARFAIGAFSGILHHTGHQWPEMKHWFESVLTRYKLQNNGQRMPIDIWNTHTYYGVWNASMTPNAQELMDKMIDPFINWVRTVDSGYYKNCDIIITEFGIAGRGCSGRPEIVIDFMEDITAILDKKVTAFFWFYGAWTNNPTWRDGCLIGPDGNPTELGWHYATLAHIWQNGIFPWERDGVTAGYLTDGADRLTVINENLYWNKRHSERRWESAGRFTDVPWYNPWSTSKMPKVDNKTAWQHGITAGYFNEDNGLLTIISKDKYWNMRLSDKSWPYVGRYDALPSHHPWSEARMPKVDGKNAWQHGITAGYITKDLGLLTIISKDKYWNMRLSDKTWISAGKYSDLPPDHIWRQAPKVLP